MRAVRTRWSRALAPAVALAGGLIVSALILELLLRFVVGLDPRYYDNAGSQRILREDTDTPEQNPFGFPLGMRMTRPGTVSRLAGHPVRINDQGLRLDRHVDLRKQPGAVRVMMVGDSVTYSNTAIEQGIPTHLEERLSERLDPTPVEVVPFSCPGWTLRDYLIAVEKGVARFEADHVVINFIMNDVPRGPVELDPDVRRRPPGSGMYQYPFLRTILRNSALGTWTHWALKGVLARSTGIDPALVTLALPDPQIRERMEFTRPVWRELQTFTRDHEMRLTVVFLPYAVQLDPELAHRVVEDWFGESLDPRVLERAPQREMLRICREEGIDCIDAAPAFASAPDIEGLFFPTPEGRIDYIHFSPKGNALTARLLAEHLEPILRERSSAARGPVERHRTSGFEAILVQTSSDPALLTQGVGARRVDRGA